MEIILQYLLNHSNTIRCQWKNYRYWLKYVVYTSNTLLQGLSQLYSGEDSAFGINILLHVHIEF